MSHLLKKSLMENFIFYAVGILKSNCFEYLWKFSGKHSLVGRIVALSSAIILGKKFSSLIGTSYWLYLEKSRTVTLQQTFISSKSSIETLEKGVKYVQILQ